MPSLEMRYPKKKYLAGTNSVTETDYNPWDAVDHMLETHSRIFSRTPHPTSVVPAHPAVVEDILASDCSHPSAHNRHSAADNNVHVDSEGQSLRQFEGSLRAVFEKYDEDLEATAHFNYIN